MLSTIRNLFEKKNQKKKRSKRDRLNVESLEKRDMMTAIALTDYEQLSLELINRARANPLAEVALNPRVNDLNQGLAPGTITSVAKQPLASHQILSDAAELHALDMLANNFFAHNNLSGQTPTDRALAAGYSEPCSNGNCVGENLAWNGSTGAIDQTAETLTAHENLFFSPTHRRNLLHDPYEHVGIGVEFGEFTHTDGITYNVVMVAEGFGFTSGNRYLTGVVFSDSVVDDDFYSIGESVAGVTITAVNTSTGVSTSTTSGASGGYNLQLANGTYTVTANGGSLTSPMTVTGVTIGSENVKVDFDTTEAPPAAANGEGPVNGEDLLGFNAGEQFWVGESNNTTLNTRFYGDWPSSTSYEIIGNGDFNGDGLDDVLGRATNGDLWVAINTGDSTFTSSKWGNFTTITTWSDFFIGDFDGDGLDDMLGRADSNGSFWLARSNGSTGFTNSHWGGFSTATGWDLYVADLNGDGNSDIVGRADSDGSWWAGLSNGSDGLTNSFWGRWSGVWSDISVGDFNGDGLDDIAGRQANTFWWVNESTGSTFNIGLWGSWTGSVNWTDVQVGDFNGDGLDDFAGLGNGQWWVAQSTGTSFQNHFYGSWPTSVVWNDISRIDIDGNGKDDLVARAANGQWWAYVSDGSQFSARLVATWSAGVNWTNITVGNFS